MLQTPLTPGPKFSKLPGVPWEFNIAGHWCAVDSEVGILATHGLSGWKNHARKHGLVPQDVYTLPGA